MVYTYSYWDGSVIDRKSTLGCFFSLGSTMIAWLSRKQMSVALSMVEAEYITTCLACIEDVWLHKFLSDLSDLELDAICIYCDNHSCIKLSNNLVFHDKSKHIDIKY